MSAPGRHRTAQSLDARGPMRVREATDPGRVPRVGDRVQWDGDATRSRRKGTVTAVYSDPRCQPFGLVFDVEWDPPIAGDPEPWAGTSRALPLSQMRRPGWGWVEGQGRSLREAPSPPYASGPRPIPFVLGRIFATPGALHALQAAAADPLIYLARHAAGDWGDVDSEDRAANNRALNVGDRLLSAYRLPDGERLWIITEADRSSSTLLLPDEY